MTAADRTADLDAAAPASVRRRPLALLSGHPAVAWAIAALFAALALVAVERDLFLNDEGVLTWIFAGLTGEAPFDLLFLLKARPPISVVYAPAAHLGLIPFLYVHVLVAALGIPLTANLARRFGHRHPNLPAALVALSPLYFGSAAAGVQNTDATVALLVVAWLLARGAPLAAGIISGLLVLGRAETLVFACAFALYTACHRDLRAFLIGLCAVPLVYVPLGALYHGELLWPLHHPPSLGSNPTVDLRERAAYGGNVGDLAVTLVALTPAVFALLWWPWRGRAALERTVVLAAIAFIAIVRVVPFFGIINFDASPRYVLPALPFLALGVSRVIDTWGSAVRPTLWRGALLLGVTAAAWVGPDRSAAVLLTGAAAGCLVAAVLAFRSASAAVGTVLVAAALLALPPLPNLRLLLGDQARVLDEIGESLAAADLPRGAIVITDYSLLSIWLTRHRPELQLDVRFLWPPDMRYELETLVNPAKGQLRPFTQTRRFFYAPWLTMDELAALPADAYVILRVENSRRHDLDQAPLRDVEWSVEGRWRGGRLRRADSEIRAGRPDAAAGSATRPPGR